MPKSFKKTTYTKFYNWTDETFVYPWAGEEYTFAPGAEESMETGRAEHFAKHLADKVMKDRGIDPGKVHLHAQFEKKALTAKPTQVSAEKLKQVEAKVESEHEADMTEKERLLQDLEELGVEADGRWSISTLKEKLDEARGDVEEDFEAAV